MTVRGTRNLLGREAEELSNLCWDLEQFALENRYQRFVPSLLAERELFAGEMGDNRMYEFQDRKGRELVLLPEVTAVVRQEWNQSWSKTMSKPVRLFYTSRCYRYDKPQAGRWREFTQFGVEALPDGDVRDLLVGVLIHVKLGNYEFRESVKRGLGYYVEEGFEVWHSGMQIAGGGRYPEGIGWALGVERLLLAREEGKSA